MDYNRAKKALLDICQYGGSGDDKEAKKILDDHPSLINEGIIISDYYSINNNK